LIGCATGDGMTATALSRTGVLAVFGVFTGNYQLSTSSPPQKSWNSSRAAHKITAGNRLVFRSNPLSISNAQMLQGVSVCVCDELLSFVTRNQKYCHYGM
jgi:hypothetical protein